ncbi:transglycosylase family protein [Streptomyces sp. NPDC007205]|uniref:transglycosylase family protein n=1 Tax=Streptomyces sp. NPDC007205 TaxID=3154316 RepID=UPI0033C2A1D7
MGVTLGLGASVAATGIAHSVSTPSATWDRIAACESGDMHTPGSGHWNLPHGDADSTGGLQIQDRTWADFGGRDIAPHAYQATKAQQIAVAARILAAQGPSAWACNSPGHGIASGALSSQQSTLAPAPASISSPKPDAAPTPGPTDQTYTVQAGDCLAKIASTLGIDGGWRALYALNSSTIGTDPEAISIGMKLKLPTAGLPTPNSSSPSARLLQHELKRTGYLSASVAYADNYGPKTQAAVQAFHRDHPQSSVDHPEAIDRTAWAYLKGMPTA